MAYNLDPKKIIITIGSIIISGFADGTFATITPDGDDFSMYRGADGTVSRANQHNNTAVLKLTLQQTAPVNDALSALREVDTVTSTGAVPVKITDLGGTTKHTASSGWIVKQPEQKYGKDVDTLEWEIQMAGYKGYIGGNVGVGA